MTSRNIDKLGENVTQISWQRVAALIVELLGLSIVYVLSPPDALAYSVAGVLLALVIASSIAAARDSVHWPMRRAVRFRRASMVGGLAVLTLAPFAVGHRHLYIIEDRWSQPLNIWQATEKVDSDHARLIWARDPIRKGVVRVLGRVLPGSMTRINWHFHKGVRFLSIPLLSGSAFEGYSASPGPKSRSVYVPMPQVGIGLTMVGRQPFGTSFPSTGGTDLVVGAGPLLHYRFAPLPDLPAWEDVRCEDVSQPPLEYVLFLSEGLRLLGECDWAGGIAAIGKAAEHAETNTERARALILLARVCEGGLSGSLGSLQGLAIYNSAYAASGLNGDSNSDLAPLDYWIADALIMCYKRYGQLFRPRILTLERLVRPRSTLHAYEIWPIDDAYGYIRRVVANAPLDSLRAVVARIKRPWDTDSKVFLIVGLEALGLENLSRNTDIVTQRAAIDRAQARVEAMKELLQAAPPDLRGRYGSMIAGIETVLEAFRGILEDEPQRRKTMIHSFAEQGRILGSLGFRRVAALTERMALGDTGTIVQATASSTYVPAAEDEWWSVDYMDYVFRCLYTLMGRATINGGTLSENTIAAYGDLDRLLDERRGTRFLPGVVALAMLTEKDSTGLHRSLSALAEQALGVPYRQAIEAGKSYAYMPPTQGISWDAPQKP